MDNRTNYRSFFWPILLIGVGALWLANNLGFVNAANLWELWRLWPLFLIVGGIDLLLGRRTPLVGAILGILVIALVGALLFTGYQLPGAAGPEVRTEYLRLPIDQARQAQVTLDFWADPVTVYPLKNSDQLIDAKIIHTGQIDFSGSGQVEKTVRLSRRSGFNLIFPRFSIQPQRTDVGLTTSLPLSLSLHTASGISDIDLTGMQLTAMELTSGSGSVTLTLPQSAQSYSARIDTRSGSANLSIPNGAALKLRLSTGSGSVSVNLPAGAAVRIDVRDSGSGSLNIPDDLTRTADRGSKSGTWETPGFSNAQKQIDITVEDFGSGSIRFTD